MYIDSQENYANCVVNFVNHNSWTQYLFILFLPFTWFSLHERAIEYFLH